MPPTLTKRSRPRLPLPGAQGKGRASGRPGLLLPVILVAQLMVVLDSTVVNVALPHIQGSLHFSGSGLSWVLNAYILTFGGLLLLGARAGDLLGRRRTFLIGIALFSVSSLVGGFAVTGWMLLATRAIQGVGGALAAPASLALLTTAFPEGAARVRAIGLYTTVSAAGGAVGLVAGGLLTELVSWRWVMFVNVPIGVAVWVLGRAVLVETERRPGRFDLAGALSSTVGVSALVLGLVEAGTVGWTDPRVVGPLIAGAALLGSFVWIEQRAAEPILPLRLFAHRTRSTANVARGLVFAGMYGMFFFLSQFLQDVQGFSPLRAGVAFLPMPVAVFLSSQLASRVLVPRFRPKALMLSGTALAMLGVLVASRVGATTPYDLVVVQLVLMGAGAGISVVSLTSASLADVAPQDAGAASGLINVTQQMGAALGVAVLVTVFAGATRHAQLGGTGAARAVLVRGIDEAFLVGAVFAAVALLLVAVFVRTTRTARMARTARTAGSATAAVAAGTAEMATNPADRDRVQWPPVRDRVAAHDWVPVLGAALEPLRGGAGVEGPGWCDPEELGWPA
ncbi:MAG: MFS transporter [Acidimicrobiales bacterium]